MHQGFETFWWMALSARTINQSDKWNELEDSILYENWGEADRMLNPVAFMFEAPEAGISGRDK